MKTYGDYLASIFPGIKVQKISVDAGFTCPNRDGTLSTGGCSYCRNDSFSPSYCNAEDDISSQLEKGRKFFARKYPEMKYLAYFQTYTGTYSSEPEKLESYYRTALDQEDIVGIVISTRPDCLPEKILSLLEKLNRIKPVFIEIGAETSYDDTLKSINRNHSWDDVVKACNALAVRNIHCGIHLIAGLPGEDRDKVLNTVRRASELPIETIKMHQLQVLYGTPLYKQWENGEIEIHEFSLDEYIDLCEEIIKIVPQHIVIERFLSQSPPNLVAFPKWGLKNFEFMNKLAVRLGERNSPDSAKK